MQRVTRTSARRVARAASALLLGGCLTLASASCDDGGTGVDANWVTLGGLFSLTGNWSSLGVTSQAAMELAVEDVNAALANRGIKFRVDVRDTRLDPATALAQLKELEHDGVQVVIGPQSSAELAALKPWADQHPVLLVSQSSTAGTLAVGDDNILRMTPADSLEGVAVSALMWADGIRTVIPVWRQDAGNQGLHVATVGRFTSLGGMVSGGIEYPAATTAFAPVVATLGNQVRDALASQPAAQVAVYLAGFDEVAALFAAAASDPVLASVRWYGSDGVALSAALLTPAAASFAQTVGYPNPIFGLDDTAQGVWKPVAERIRARAGTEPDAFALAVYDAVWIAAQSYLTLGRNQPVEELRERFVATAGAYYGTTGWTVLNAAGDRGVADFDFWAIRASGGAAPAWKRVASFDTRFGTLVRY